MSLIRDQLLSEILYILQGIDKTETEDVDGWWETSAGARFGENVITQIKELLRSDNEQN